MYAAQIQTHTYNIYNISKTIRLDYYYILLLYDLYAAAAAGCKFKEEKN